MYTTTYSGSLLGKRVQSLEGLDSWTRMHLRDRITNSTYDNPHYVESSPATASMITLTCKFFYEKRPREISLVHAGICMNARFNS